MGTNPQPTIQMAHDAAQALHDKLVAAGNAATNGADSQAVSDALAAVDKIITRLNQEDMDSRTGQMNAAAADVDGAVKTLTSLKAQLAEIANRIAVLASVASDVDAVVNGAKSVFGL